MARKTDLTKLCFVNGTYRRTIGKFVNSKGNVAPKKFLLGPDRRRAAAANLRLEQLWEVVLDDHKILAASRPAWEQSSDTPPLWSGIALDIADAVRLHQHVIRVGHATEYVESAAGYASHIHYLTAHYGDIIGFLPAEPQDFRDGQEQHRQVAQHRARQAARNAKIADVLIPTDADHQTLYAAIDDFGHHAADQARTENGGKKARDDAQKIKQAIADMPLSNFNYDAIEKIGQHWRSRPPSRRKGKGGGKPIAVSPRYRTIAK